MPVHVLYLLPAGHRLPDFDFGQNTMSWQHLILEGIHTQRATIVCIGVVFMANRMCLAASLAASLQHLAYTAATFVTVFVVVLCCAALHWCQSLRLYGTGGVDDASAFTENLIEEPDALFSSQNRQAIIGFVSFLEQVKFEIHQFIEHQM